MRFEGLGLGEHRRYNVAMGKYLSFGAIFVFAMASIGAEAQWGHRSSRERGSSGISPRDKRLENFRDLSRHDFVVPNMIYATKNNFVGENIYGNFNKPYVHHITDEKLQKANEELQKLRPGWKFKVYDALRPHHCQHKLWDKVKGTPSEGYVMNPKYGSIHSFGFALDITLVDEKGREVDMGTPVDSFDRLSQPRHEKEYLASGKLTKQQYENRQVLRKSMVKGGFHTISNEWWHFEALPGDVVRRNYPIFE